jgi:hypothetical protein
LSTIRFEKEHCMTKLVKGGLTLAAGGLVIHLSHGWVKPVDLFCSPPALPACGTSDEAPSAPPLSSVFVTASVAGSSSATVVFGGTFVDTVTDEEHSIPAQPFAGIRRQT